MGWRALGETGDVWEGLEMDWNALGEREDVWEWTGWDWEVEYSLGHLVLGVCLATEGENTRKCPRVEIWIRRRDSLTNHHHGQNILTLEIGTEFIINQIRAG